MTRRSLTQWFGFLLAAKLLPSVAVASTPVPVETPGSPLPAGETRDPVARKFLDALETGRTVAVFYQGGTTPGALRRFTPQSVHRLRPGGPLYATGLCHLRGETRTLRLDRARLG